MFGEVFYGGHITDGMDRRACTTYLQVCAQRPAGCMRAHAHNTRRPPCCIIAAACTDARRRCPAARLVQVLIRPEILPGGQLADPSTWSPPSLELAPGFRAPLPASFAGLLELVEAGLPTESPVVRTPAARICLAACAWRLRACPRERAGACCCCCCC